MRQGGAGWENSLRSADSLARVFPLPQSFPADEAVHTPQLRLWASRAAFFVFFVVNIQVGPTSGDFRTRQSPLPRLSGFERPNYSHPDRRAGAQGETEL